MGIGWWSEESLSKGIFDMEEDLLFWLKKPRILFYRYASLFCFVTIGLVSESVSGVLSGVLGREA